MIYGIIAAAAEADLMQQAGAEVQAKGAFDFVNGTYDWQGSSFVASDIIDQTGWLGASGLEVPGSASAGAAIQLIPLQVFLAAGQFTIAFEAEVDTNKHQSLLRIQSTDADLFAWLEWQGWFFTYEQSREGSNYSNRQVEDDSQWETGTYRVAMTRIDGRLSMSVNGATAATQTDVTVTIPIGERPVTEWWIGGLNWTTYDGVNIHWMRIYDPVSDEQLKLLSI